MNPTDELRSQVVFQHLARLPEVEGVDFAFVKGEVFALAEDGQLIQPSA